MERMNPPRLSFSDLPSREPKSVSNALLKGLKIERNLHCIRLTQEPFALFPLLKLFVLNEIRKPEFVEKGLENLFS